MKIAAMLIVLALWIAYQRGHDTKPVTSKCHNAINALYFAMFVAAGAFVK